VDDVVKYLLAGADAVMTASALLQHGVGHMRMLVDRLSDWLERRDMDDRGVIFLSNAGCRTVEPHALGSTAA
jgi:hypothetical protein